LKKQEYLKKLNQALWLHISKEERKEILLDYEEYFSEGIANGESEEKVSAHLGQPQTAAKALIAERGSLLFSKQSLLMLVSMVLPFLALWSMSWDFWLYFGGDYNLWVSPYFIFLLGIVGFVLRSWPWKRSIKQTGRVYPIVVVCVSSFVIGTVIVILLWFYYNLFLPYDLSDDVPGHIVELWIGLVVWLRRILMCCVMVTWLWLLGSRKNNTPIRQTLNLWLSGLLGFIAYGGITMRSLDDPEFLSTFVFWASWLWPIIVGFVVTGGMMLILRQVAKRSNEH
jgi:hypothetical protein